MSSNPFANPVIRSSRGLALSYIFDWIIVIAIAALGAGFSKISPNRRPFDLADPNISFPYVEKPKISVGALFAIALAAPACIIAFVSLLRVPGPPTRKDVSKSVTLRAKLWEWHTGWLGLALALASVFLVTEGSKNLFGKPRPDLLSRCDADLTKIAANTVGGYGDQVSQGVVLVTWKICRQADQGILRDGFASFPSGHSSFSWAGLTYLALFICSKLAIRIPYLLPYPYSAQTSALSNLTSEPVPHPKLDNPSPTSSSDPSSPSPLHRHQAAAPPLYLLIPAFIPMGAAMYISSTRYSDFRHHGFDIIVGSLMGFVSAWASFRLYHLPVRRGAGWSWGPRHQSRPWVGGYGYAEGENSISRREDLEGGELTGGVHT